MTENGRLLLLALDPLADLVGQRPAAVDPRTMYGRDSLRPQGPRAAYDPRPRTADTDINDTLLRGFPSDGDDIGDVAADGSVLLFFFMDHG
jgi:hypothetical protein